MIQGFTFQVNNFANNQNKVNVRNNQSNSKNSFNDVLDNKAKSREVVTNDKNKTQNNDEIIRQQKAQVNNRRVDIKSEQANDKSKGQSEQNSVKQEEGIDLKKEKTIEDFIENLSEILAVFQNVLGININKLEGINPEDLNLEISLEELENLKLSLQSIIDSFDLGSSEQEIKEAITNIGKMIQDVSDNGEMEVSAEEFIAQLKEVVDSINSQVYRNNGKSLSKEVEKSSIQLQNLVKTIEDSKEKSTDMESLKKQPTENTDIKIKIVTQKQEGVNLFDLLGELEDLNIKTIEKIDPSIEQMPINILSNNSDVAKSENLSKTVNNAALNPEQFMDIDKLDVLKQITSKVKTDYENELKEIKIKLNPQHLGELTIKVSLERGILSARAFVENTNIKQLLESNIDELKNNLKEQGVDFSSIDVSVGSDSNFNERNPNFFMNHKRVQGLKTKTENPVDINHYEDLNESNQTSSLTPEEGGVDITI